jgi:aspartate carbamoyltransferase regulatory subunit
MNYKLIGYIQSGVVIDHIPRGKVWKVAKIIKIKNKNTRISLADNCGSKKIKGGKGLIKIENFYPSDKELNLISIIAPNATIITIKNGIVDNKRKVELPDVFKEIIFCPNINCISNQKKEKIKSLIYFKEGKFKCHYCNSFFSEVNLEE